MEKELEIFIEAAEHLQALKATLTEQQGSSVRLRSVIDALERVTSQIAKIPSGLSSIVTKAEAVEKRVIAVISKVEALRDEIPAIVGRIERSDVGKSVDALTNDIAESRGDLKAFRESIAQIDEVVQRFQGANEAVFKELKEDVRTTGEAQEKVNASVNALRSELLSKLDGVEKRIVSTEELSKQSIDASGKAFELVSVALKGAGDRQLTALQGFQGQLDALKAQEMAEMRKDLKSISAQIQQQGAALEILAKKRGFSF